MLTWLLYLFIWGPAAIKANMPVILVYHENTNIDYQKVNELTM